MKKTIITLFALSLSGIAMGAQTTKNFTFTSVSDVISFDSIDLAQDWTLTLNLTTTVTSGFNDWGTPILSSENDPTAATQLIQVYAKDAGDAIVVKANNGNDDYTASVGNNVQNAWKDTSVKNFVLNYDVETTTLTLNVTTQEGVSIVSNSWSSVSYTGKKLTQLKTGISQDMIQSQKWTLPSGSFTYGKDDAVPEPTTATLSLLALAGLAARRRRK